VTQDPHQERSEDEVITAPDGRMLMVKSRGWSPLDYDDDGGLYLRPPSMEVVIWVLTAAASGIVGNLATDALKGAIARARHLHSATILPLWRDYVDQYERGVPIDARIEPSDELREKLVQIAQDTMQRFRHLSPSQGKKLSTVTRISLTRQGTWKLHIRESGSPDRLVMEIDVQAIEAWDELLFDTFDERPTNPEGFPVKIWY
jgi:hypothetical protein